MDSPSSDNDGAHLLAQAPSRKRPIRTYGRHGHLTPCRDAEPPRKKRVIEDSDHGDNSNNDSESRVQSCPPSSPQLPKLPNTSGQTSSVKRGSILAFFKPIVASSSSSALPSQIWSDATQQEALPSSPPSSPPPLPRPAKRRRRLMTRVHSLGDEEAENERKDTGEDGPDMAETNVVVREEYGAEESRTTESEQSPVLQQLKNNMLNAGRPAEQQMASEGFKVKHEAKRRVRKATVQTTLNLSMADEPGFILCRDCEILYNPLNEKDRKDHARRHSAVIRRKATETLR